MANSLLTPTQVVRESLRILHQKASFISSIYRGYDDSFAQTGAKIGDTLKIRLPNEYITGTGATATFSDTTESTINLQVATQRWVAMGFTTAELSLSLDDFSKRIIDPAMSKMASMMEADALTMVKDVANLVDDDGNPLSWKDILKGRQKLNESLAPMDNMRTALINPTHSTTIVDALKGLFQDSTEVSKQYKEGRMGRSAGFDFIESTILGSQLTGTAAKVTGYTVNGAGQTGASITVATGTTTFKKGDVITFAGTNNVHQETKADYGYAKQFVVTADYAGGAGNISIDPAIVVTGASQNVTASPSNTGAVTKVGAGVSETYTQSLLFHRDAFAFASADLVMPKGMDFAARETLDGISMRIVRDYDITNDKLLSRVDCLYGFKTIRPQLATRVHADG